MQKLKNAQHWRECKELGKTNLPVTLLFGLFKIFPVVCLRALAFPVSFFYFVFAKQARHESQRYLKKIFAVTGKRLNPLFHITAYALTLIEKIEAWAGGKDLGKRISYNNDDVDQLISLINGGKGTVLVVSHSGNIEFARSLADSGGTKHGRPIPVNAIVDFSVTPRFNQMLKKLNPQSETNIISANDIGSETVISLMNKLEQGEIVSIAGDRTSANTSKCITIPFLGTDAGFAYGPFLISALFNVPTFFVFALRKKDVSLSCKYEMHVHRSNVTFDCSRAERENRIKNQATDYAGYLEKYCKEHPYQWYNFFNFWAV
ncbi:MAG: hypothetical protein Ta2F_05120 [Termitinemataceae bacterium]|nr:MAG: hypothetical protein Ta2F_05120 [Termitinemataceae bacterium]